MQHESGQFDRRISVELATETRDAANDPVLTWSEVFPRWAMKQDLTPTEHTGPGQVVRQIDTAWLLRWDSESRAIAPETYRFVWRGRIYEIVGVAESTVSRMDALRFLCCSTPDRRGERAPQNGST